ncbi:MAG: agmatine/peptidylarginine deiminase [Opitutales bacterium]
MNAADSARYAEAKPSGFRFPAEWEPQAAVWFAWPVRGDLWPGSLEVVRRQLAGLYAAAARFQPVRVLCPLSAQPELRERLAEAGDSSGVALFDYETDDVWIRDFGPLFLRSDAGQIVIADWHFNAWGEKFPKYQKDDRASAWIAEQLGLPRWQMEPVLEGGAVESNGAGQLLTTEDVLLNPNRNGDVCRRQVEAWVADGLAVDQVLWLKAGLVGDDTDGHIDNLARFFKTDGILLAEATDPANPNRERLEENARRITAMRTPGGQAYELRRLPLPDPVYHGGEILAASYLNFTVLNGAVFVPTYHQLERDAEAVAIIGACFPGREVVAVDCREIIKEGGALHCMSQHQPA